MRRGDKHHGLMDLVVLDMGQPAHSTSHFILKSHNIYLKFFPRAQSLLKLPKNKKIKKNLEKLIDYFKNIAFVFGIKKYYDCFLLVALARGY